MSSLADPLRRAACRLEAAGVPSPRYDAEELAAYSLGTERRELWKHAEAGAGFWVYVDRRAGREPLQHITGRAYFRHLTLAVGPGVFLPRPETEVVAEAAIEAARALPAPLVVDLGTGSGALAASIATEVAHATVHAVEVDPGAHAWARRNLAGTGVELRLGDLAEAFPELDGRVDVVVSNPPYIPIGAQIRDPEVAAHDPAAALWSGDEGLDAIRAVERAARRLLRPGGVVVVEHADVQGAEAPAVFERAGAWTDVADFSDLADRPRYLTARAVRP